MPLAVNLTSEWFNSFVIVLKSNCTIHLCLDPTRLNKELSRPVHRGPTINDIFSKKKKQMHDT